MPAIITTESRIHAIESFANAMATDNIFLFAGRPEEWTDETSPDLQYNSVDDDYVTRENIIFAKQNDGSEYILGIKRFNWTSGVVYTQYNSYKNQSDPNTWIGVTQTFYVISSAGNVYKCIYNNNNSPCANEPDTVSDIIQTTADGYKWKFMFDIGTTQSDTYLSDMWIPIPPVGDRTANHNNVVSNATFGTIETIDVINSGSYSGAEPTVNIIGDGFNAQATVTMDGSAIDYITVTNVGSDYTYATLSIIGTEVEAAELKANVIPGIGHGADTERELYANYLLLNGNFVDNEATVFPEVNDYRMIGLIKDLKKTSDGLDIGITAVPFYTALLLNTITGTFNNDELVTAAPSGATGIIFKPITGDDTLYIIKVNGTFGINDTLSAPSGSVGTISTITSPIVNKYSGNIIYKESFQPITRATGQTESFVLGIEF